jgi:hypothetical protein
MTQSNCESVFSPPYGRSRRSTEVAFSETVLAWPLKAPS